MITRGLANKATPTVTFAKNPDGSWTFTTNSVLRFIAVDFKLGEEFEETTFDGRHCKVRIFFQTSFVLSLCHTMFQSVFTFANGKLKQVQKNLKQGERDTEVIREVSGDKLTVVRKQNRRGAYWWYTVINCLFQTMPIANIVCIRTYTRKE